MGISSVNCAISFLIDFPRATTQTQHHYTIFFKEALVRPCIFAVPGIEILASKAVVGTGKKDGARWLLFRPRTSNLLHALLPRRCSLQKPGTLAQ